MTQPEIGYFLPAPEDWPAPESLQPLVQHRYRQSRAQLLKGLEITERGILPAQVVDPSALRPGDVLALILGIEQRANRVQAVHSLSVNGDRTDVQLELLDLQVNALAPAVVQGMQDFGILLHRAHLGEPQTGTSIGLAPLTATGEDGSSQNDINPYCHAFLIGSVLPSGPSQ